MKIFGVLFLILCLLRPNFVLAQESHLVISQIQVAGDGGANDEFIELYNSTAQPVSLNGWSLQYKSAASNFPLSSKKNLPDVIIEPGKYYLVAHNEYNGSVVADLKHSSFALSASTTGGTIFLVNHATALASSADVGIVDRVGYGDSINNAFEGANAPLPGTEQSLLRSDTDTDNNLADFTVVVTNPRNITFQAPVDVTPPPPPPPVLSTPPPTEPSPTPPPPAPSPVPAPAPSPQPPPPPTPIVYSEELKLVEIFPNPKGVDSGAEWVVIENESNESVNLKDWILDDGLISEAIGSNAYVLPETSVGAEKQIKITIPAGKFAINNTGVETIRLFDPNKSLVSSATFEESKEDLSITLEDGDWVILGDEDEESEDDEEETVQEDEDEEIELGEFSLIINELMPYPKPGEEYIEILNNGDIEVNLKNFKLTDGVTTYKFPETVLKPGKLEVVYKKDSKISLNNSNSELVQLFDSQGNLVSEVEYEDPSVNESLNLDPEGEYVWSTSLTPGKENEIQEGQVKGAKLPKTGMDLLVLLKLCLGFGIFLMLTNILIIRKHE